MSPLQDWDKDYKFSESVNKKTLNLKIMLLPKGKVISIVADAILSRTILVITYKHTRDGDIADYKIAPFDIGSTNPNSVIRANNADKLYAYSFTHKDKNSHPDPKVCAFNINNFVEMKPTGDIFDETELAIKNLSATKYDYRSCKFAFEPHRNWFQKTKNLIVLQAI